MTLTVEAQQELKLKWLEALRSGRYQQGTRRLRTTDGCFCCLGVLCDLVGGTWEEYTNYDGLVLRTFTYEQQKAHIVPPSKLVTDLNLDVISVGRLAKMNDREGLSFDQIADWIEQEFTQQGFTRKGTEHED